MIKSLYPKINYEKCTGCMTCISSCCSGVYEEKDGKPIIANPDKCTREFKQCSKMCPVGAIENEKNEEESYCSNCDCECNCVCDC